MCRSGSPSSRNVATVLHAASCQGKKKRAEGRGRVEGRQAAGGQSSGAPPAVQRAQGGGRDFAGGWAGRRANRREGSPLARPPALGGCGLAGVRTAPPSPRPARRAAPRRRAPAATWHTAPAPSSCACTRRVGRAGRRQGRKEEGRAAAAAAAWISKTTAGAGTTPTGALSRQPLCVTEGRQGVPRRYGCAPDAADHGALVLERGGQHANHLWQVRGQPGGAPLAHGTQRQDGCRAGREVVGWWGGGGGGGGGARRVAE